MRKDQKRRVSYAAAARRDRDKIARLVGCGDIDETIRKVSAGNRELEDELRQEAFLAMFEMAHRGIAPAESIRKVVGMVIRGARPETTLVRARDIEAFVETPEESPPETEEEDSPHQELIHEALRARVRRLPETQKKAIIRLFGMFNQEQMQMKDIAREMGTKRQSVNVNVEKALRNLRREMYPFFGTGEE